MSKGTFNQFLRGNTAHRFFKIVTLAVTSCVLVTMITIDASASSGGRGTLAVNQLNPESTLLSSALSQLTRFGGRWEPWSPPANPATAPSSAPVTPTSSGSSTDTDAPATTTTSTTKTNPAPTTTSTQSSSPKPSAGTSETPIIGVLGVSGNYFSQERAAGIGAVTINVGWNEAEPSPGTFSSSYLSSLQAEIAAARSAGLSVVLDPGLQYPPNWVFSLPGGTRFVDQYGDVFTGSEDSGNNAVNGVTDLAVRNAEGSYLAWLGSKIQPGEIIGIREGGGPLGELAYPSNVYEGHTNSFWAYDASTQATSPVPGWTPGTGSASQARAFLDAYNTALDSFGSWLNGELGADFATNVLVLLPGWGERPGSAANEVASLLTLNMPEFNEGLDWPDLFHSLPDASKSVAYTTWLDAPTYGQTPQLEDPADYIASLATTYHLRLGGENTGGGSIAAATLSFDRAKKLSYYIVQWMNEPQLISSGSGRDPSGPTLLQLGSMGAKLLGA